ncbi:glucokinase [Paracoccus aminophilus]|uniref:Glucokinase n=1 Tax=Paracoccus aminophilus JCM 7686 TaxID=1367847 RepID=S5Y6T3_PARAH|nr:glucokinase [Paracoccus aminophilus]AGT11295.1 glucokinase [Paracoccus aminophilus JCM 7686]
MAILLADVGGTNARLALARDGRVDPASVTRFRGDDYPSFDDVIRAYLDQQGHPALEAVCVDVAGPVSGGVARLTNRDWDFTEARLRELTGAPVARLINDLTALGYATPSLGEDGVTVLRAAPETRPRNGQALVVNAGTGFNVCAVKVLPSGGIVCLEAEEGHTRLPVNIATRLLIELGERAAPFTSTEELFAGRGLARLHEARTGETGMRAEDVVTAATAGDPEALRTHLLYTEIFGILCRELAMRFMPIEGMYLAGSVARSCADRMDVFGPAFLSDPLMRQIPERVPVLMIRDDLAALYGCLAAVG